jgi:ATP-dependent protease ClpP protease subunit
LKQGQITPPQTHKFWDFIAAAADKPAELILYGDISTYSWWGDEITPKQFNDDLRALGDVSEIVVRINSGGGDVFAANAIYTRLKDHKAKITVKIDGWAASAATIIAMSGDTIQIPANGVFMIHDPKMGVIGYYAAEEFIKLSEELTVIKQAIINGYALKTGKDEAEISALMSAATWYNGKQAVDSGFCDEVMFGEVKTEVENDSRVYVNSIPFDLDRYPSIPTKLLNSRTPAAAVEHINQNQNKKGVNERMEIKNVEELRAAYPELTTQIATEATAAERKRIQDIEGIALAGFEGVINKAKFETPVTAAEVAVNIIAEQKKSGAAYLANVNEDVKNSGTGEVNASGHEGANDKTNPYDAAIDKHLPDPNTNKGGI